MKTKDNTKLSEQQRKFCRGVASGMSLTQAALKAGYAKRSAGVQANRLMKNAKVRACLEEMRSKTEAAADLTRAEAVRWLGRVVRTAVGELDASNDLAQSVKFLDGKEGRVLEIKGHDKIRALERLAKMLGWDEPEKVDVGASDPLMAVLAGIRSRKGGAA